MIKYLQKVWELNQQAFNFSYFSLLNQSLWEGDDEINFFSFKANINQNDGFETIYLGIFGGFLGGLLTSSPSAWLPIDVSCKLFKGFEFCSLQNLGTPIKLKFIGILTLSLKRLILLDLFEFNSMILKYNVILISSILRFKV